MFKQGHPLYGGFILSCVWLPGPFYANVRARQSEYDVFLFDCFLPILLFPIYIVLEGVKSLCKRESSNIEAFQDLKKYEILFEANCQVIVSGLVILDGISNHWIQYVSFSFSLLSLMHGVWSLTENMADNSAHIKTLKKMGRALYTLMIIRAPLAAVISILRLKHALDTQDETFFISLLIPLSWYLLMFIFSILYRLLDDMTLIPCPVCQMVSEMFLLVWGLYIYFEDKIVITGLFEQIVFVYIFLIEQTLLVVFHTIFLTNPHLFYLENPDDDACC